MLGLVTAQYSLQASRAPTNCVFCLAAKAGCNTRSSSVPSHMEECFSFVDIWNIVLKSANINL